MISLSDAVGIRNEEYNWAGRTKRWPGTPMSISRPGRSREAARLCPGDARRQVRHNGEVKWRGHMLYLSEVLAQEPVGFTPIGETTWAVHYSFHLLGTLDERTLTITSARQWHQPDDPQAM